MQSGRIYDRHIVFLTPGTDSTLMVPWLISARARPGAVAREARAWLTRGGVWEPFFQERWETAPSRVPWRLLPRGRMRIVVGEADALERIVFESGPRHLETVLGPTRVEWNGRRGESYRLLDGAALLANQRIEGLILDVSRARRPEDPPSGDWALLTSGDSLQVLLAASEARPPGTAGAYQGWARLDFRELQWPRVSVSWSEARAFERARRDVPVEWRARSSDGELVAVLNVRSAQLQAGEGEGPLLPVDALFEIEGTVTIGGIEYPVRGIHRHLQF
ncbi:MAG: hypothetical protein KY453_01400 [Gemmatimonadetes bacterium]|nr:hypothetical protein [Gemmatimonadota bacterium]